MRIRHDDLLTGVGVFALAEDRLDRCRAGVVGEPGVQLECTVDSITAAVPSASFSEPSRKGCRRGSMPSPADPLSPARPPAAQRRRADPGSITSASFADHVADRLGAYVELSRWLVTHA